MTAVRPIPLDSPDDRDRACAAVRVAPRGMVVHIRPKKRSLDQNAYLHAIFEDCEKSGYEWNGSPRKAWEWKWLFTNGHAIATGRQGEMMLGLEGERLMLRPSTSEMSVAELSELLEYTVAWCTMHGIKLREPT